MLGNCAIEILIRKRLVPETLIVPIYTQYVPTKHTHTHMYIRTIYVGDGCLNRNFLTESINHENVLSFKILPTCPRRLSWRSYGLEGFLRLSQTAGTAGVFQRETLSAHGPCTMYMCTFLSKQRRRLII